MRRRPVDTQEPRGLPRDASPARRWVVALGVAALVVGGGCGGDKTAAKLEGTWKGVRSEGVSAEQKPAADAYANSLRLDFKGHDLTLASPKGQQKGPYKVVSSDGKTIVLATERDGIDAKQTFLLDGDTTLKWKVDDTKMIVFTK
mgnify:FL=1|jgi:hypothetical protein